MKNTTSLRVVLVLFVLAAEVFSTTAVLRVQAASIPPSLHFTQIVSGLTDPVFVTNAGDGSNRLFIIEQTGQILVYKNGGLLSTPFLNIAGLISNFTGVNGEQGLLCLAFDPNYSSNGIFYITYTTTNNDPAFLYTTTLARYHVSSGSPDQADPLSGAVLLSIPKKYTNHNGGMIAFGPDGYLYMSMGDGGSGGDPDNNAQNLDTMLGKLLRLDVESAPPPGQNYVIPPTNPFFGSTDPNVKKEIWAYGLRNPWRYSFDRSTGDLYIGDVGQAVEEEIDFQGASSAGGENFGWHILEGNLCFNPSTNCIKPTGYVPPVATYDHGANDSFGCAVTGGYVYRGSQYLSLQGVYLYGDFCSGKVLGLIKNPNNTWTASVVTSTGFTISSFGQDEQGELYLTNYGGGAIYHISSGSVTISGNAGIAGAMLGYVDGTLKTVTAQPDGSYQITVPYNWSGTVTPSLSGYGFNPGSRSYANLQTDLTSQDYTAVTAWFGGVQIQADQNVAVIGRPQIGGQVMAFNGPSSGSTTMYMPMLFKNAFGAYNSALYVQDLDPINTASIAIAFYDTAGNLTCTINDSLPPLAAHGTWLPNLSCLGTSWVGSAEITSNHDIAAVGRPHLGSQITSYNGFASGSTTMILPVLFMNASGSSNSAFYVQDLDASNTAHINLNFYDQGGNPTCARTDTIPPFSSHGYWLPDLSCLGSSWTGGVVITSDQNIAAVGRLHLGSQITTYDGFSSGSTAVSASMLFKNAFGSYNSSISIQDISTTNTANITLRFYDSSGTLTCTQTDAIAPLGMHSYSLTGVSCLGTSWVGGVQVASDQNIVLVSQVVIGNETAAYDGFTAGNTLDFAPMMFRYAFDGSYNSALYIQNLDSTNTANITINLYDSSGSLSCTHTDSLPALASRGYWLPTMTCP